MTLKLPAKLIAAKQAEQAGICNVYKCVCARACVCIINSGVA